MALLSNCQCRLLAVALLFFAGVVCESRADLWLGDPPAPPASSRPVVRPHLQTVTGGFSVDTGSREQVQSFFNAVYLSSEAVSLQSTAIISTCVPGTNAPDFADAVLRRINWFRAMAGLPAGVTFSAANSSMDQSAALIMSANTNLQHTGIPVSWHCFSTDGTNGAANSNLALGDNGPSAITGYIWDFGANNAAVGHRRWILYPQTQVMGSGDVPAGGNYQAANATWIIDGNYGGPRPATRTDYVAWPPAGYVPYQVVFPQWSFALSNADFSAATVSMRSNGVSVPVTLQPMDNRYGENTLVWYPSSLNPASQATAFPFNGTDTTYAMTVSNVVTEAGLRNFSYSVTVFDPALAGPDTVVFTVSGTNQPTVNADNPYTCPALSDPNVTGYELLSLQTNNGNFFDGGEGGSLTNFSAMMSAGYPAITNSSASGQTGSACFHLAMPITQDQTLQLNRVFLPRTNTSVTFKSLLGYATTNQIAELQVTTNNGNFWQDLYSQAGTGGAGDTSFIARSLSLSNYAGVPVLLRFKYHYVTGGGSFFPQVSTNPLVGWFFDNVTVTNTLTLVNPTTNAVAVTNFFFAPQQRTNYQLQARAVLFNEFPLAWGPLKSVMAVTSSPVIVMASPMVSNTQLLLPFNVSGGPAGGFQLLQLSQLGAAWVTNGSATLTTNVSGRAFTFTTTNGQPARYYRVKAP